MSEESEEESSYETPPTRGSMFALLKDDSDEYEYEEEEKAPIPVFIPPPPPPKEKGKKKQKIDEEDETAFLEQLAEENRQRAAANPGMDRNRKMNLNIARELSESYGEHSFDDSLRLPKNSAPWKFIARRRDWPNVTTAAFKTQKVSKDLYIVTKSESHAAETRAVAAVLETQDPQLIARIIRDRPFNPKILMFMTRSALYNREFSEATEYILKLTWILQQTMPADYNPNTRFKNEGDIKDLLEIVAIIAQFCFRRTCYETSFALWRFALEIVPEDPLGFGFCAAIPALMHGEADYIRAMLHSDRTVGGIPYTEIPDWGITDALIHHDEQALDLQCARWPYILGNFDIPDGIPNKLGMIIQVCKHRLNPYIEANNLGPLIAASFERAAAIDAEAMKKETIRIWSQSKVEVDVTFIFEEASLQVG